MKNKALLILSIVSVFTIISCDEILNELSSTEIAAELEGQWSVDESSDLFKAAQQGYTVYIEPAEPGSSDISIEGFYGLGTNTTAKASVGNYTLTLAPNQGLTGGYTIISGSGTISKNLKEINLNYVIDDGSGEYDNVKATYTFLY